MLLMVVVLALGSIPALADSLQLGGNYTGGIVMVIDGNTKTEGGGPIMPSYWNGQALDYVYCVDLFHNVNVPFTYTSASVNDDGIVNGAAVNNAGKVAWLLGTYANAQGTNKAALQAAIWTTIFNGYQNHTVALSSTNTQTVKDAYNSYLSALGNNTGDVSEYMWFTPSPRNDMQGLVGHVPDGGMTLVLLGGALVGLQALRRRFQA